jgi:branched-chain amino acid transport system permease protein
MAGGHGGGRRDGLGLRAVIVRPVYGLHLKQILITMGGMIVGEEIIKVIWGPLQIALPLPDVLRGAWSCPSAMRRSRSTACWPRPSACWCSPRWACAGAHQGRPADPRRRAGPRDGRVAGLPHPRLFVGVFVAGSALAGLGGVMWGLYQQSVTPQIGAQVNVLIFIVIIIGGLGSTLGCFVGALLVGLMANYTGFLAPKVALFSNIG